MLLNKKDQEQFKQDYVIMTYPQLQEKYRTSVRKMIGIATEMNIMGLKKNVRVLGSKHVNSI